MVVCLCLFVGCFVFVYVLVRLGELGMMKKIIIGVVLCLVVVYGYSKFRYVDFVDVGIFCSVWVVFEFVMVVFVCYSCDGCMYCLYMCLCEEVMYFI